MRLHLFKALPFALAASFVQAQSLPEAMQQALDVHPEIQAGVNSRLAADYQLKAAKGGYLPKVDLLGGYGREGTDSVTTRANGGGNGGDGSVFIHVTDQSDFDRALGQPVTNGSAKLREIEGFEHRLGLQAEARVIV